MHIVTGDVPVEVRFLKGFTDADEADQDEPYVVVKEASSPHLTHVDLAAAHKTCTDTFTQPGHFGTPPLSGCKGIYGVGPVLYYSLCALFEVVAGFYNRAWERKGQRCFWYSPERVQVAESVSGFTKVKPTQAVLLVVPEIQDGCIAKLVVPAYTDDRSYCALHGICGQVDVRKLHNSQYIDEIWQRDINTWHFEKGGNIEVCILRNSPSSSAGIYVDPCDNEHFEKQCTRFRQQRGDPKRKTPRAWTAQATVDEPDWHVVALYMLHGLPTAHVHFGKVVADPAGLAGNGFILNRGKLKDLCTKAGVSITSKSAYIAARKVDTEEDKLAEVKPDFLIQGEFVFSDDEIINAMSSRQRAYFENTLIPALREVQSKGATYYTDK